MTKNLFTISALLCAAALITGCSNEEMMENGTSAGDVTLVATTGANTKTTVDDKYNVNWTSGDAFYVFGKKKQDNSYSSKGTFNWTSGTSTEGKFKGTVTGKMADLQYAVYPADKYTYNSTSGKMTVTFPETYTHPNSNAPMFGKVKPGEGRVEFDQLLCGMMRVTVNGLPTGKSGSLKLEGANVAGPATLTIDDNTGKASLAAISEGGASAVTVSFTESSDPLVLDIPLPEGKYENGLTATLTINGTSDPAEAFTTEKNFDVTAGKIKEMPEINIAEITSSTISFVKEVANVTDAIQALAEGSKNVTINEVKANESIEIPESNSPITININTVGESFTVKGAESATTKPVVKINVPAGSTGTVTAENVERLEINGNWTVAETKATTGDGVLEVKAGTGVKELVVKNINHIEISGNWEKVTSSTSENTLVVKADAKVADLTVKQGNIEIVNGGVVNKLTLETDVTINKALIIPSEQTMEIILDQHKLTLTGNNTYVRGNLKLIGASADQKGTVIDQTGGIGMNADDAYLTMENVAYEATYKDGNGIFTDPLVSRTTINIKNSTMKGKYFCIATNARETVGTNNAITLESSDFTADETALMVNTPAKVTAKNCNFTGGWQGAFLRAGDSTFDACSFNLDVNSKYTPNTVQAGATVWGGGNQAPSAAITAGNKTGGNAYKRKASFELKNGCTFSVKIDGNVDTEKTYPAIYIDAENEETQGVTFKYDNKAFESAGTGLDIRNKDKVTEVNNIPI